jgi:hypothetical protein
MRDEMVRFLPGSRFLNSTHMGGNAVVGLQAKPLTRLAEGEDFLAAYHELHKQVVGEEMCPFGLDHKGIC